jgi:hypothetical protein
MKKMLLISLLSLSMFANGQSYKKGQVDLSLGVGFGATFISSEFSTTSTPISASLDFGLSDRVSIGGYFSLIKAEWKMTGTDVCNSGNGNGNYSFTYVDTYIWKYSIAGLRAAYHFTPQNEKLDTYGGIMLGNNFASSSFSSVTNPYCDKHDVIFTGKNYGGLIAAAFLGARYRFSNNIGVYGELGYGVTYLNIGLNFRI